jgi:hypothetical protein
MFALYGYMVPSDARKKFVGISRRERYEPRTLIALFTSEEKAKAYVMAAELKKPLRSHVWRPNMRQTFIGDKIYKFRTLLSNYESVEIEEQCIPDGPPIDPVIE